jgi:hypothetical protein
VNESTRPNAEVLRAISALAVVKVNWDDSKDYIANFVPIIAHCIRRGEHDAISVPETQALVQESFGLRIPLGPLQTILNRMSKHGLVRRHHGTYARIPERLEEFDLGAEREDVLRQHANLVARLVEFAASIGRDWDEEQAERALLSYVEVLAEPILAAVVDGEPVVELPKIDSEGSVVTNRFVLALCDSEPEAFEYLVTVVKGSMLANVLFLPEAFAGGRARLAKVEIYLDTPIVLRALGYAEQQYRVPAEELLGLLEQEDAKLRIFEHTLHEVEGVLDGAAANYRSGLQKDHFPGDVVDYFASESLSRSDVELQIAALRDRLQERSIEVVDAPEHSEELGLDERALEAALKEGVHYGRHGTMVKDLNSLTAIYRLREGEARRHIESANAVLVTTNSRLAHSGRLFFAETFGHRSVPLCMNDHALAALAWLMNPAQAPDLPRCQIIATSYAALNPPDDVWRKYLAEIRRLQERNELTEEQVGLLLFSPDARLELMNATSGDPAALATGTISQVLRYAEAAARREVEEELRRERERSAEIEAGAAAARELGEQDLRRAQELADRHGQRLDTRAREIAAGVSWLAFGILLVVLLLACMAAAEGLFPASWSRLVPLGSAFVFLLALASAVNLVVGWNLLQAQRWLTTRLDPRIRTMLHSWFGFSETR